MIGGLTILMNQYSNDINKFVELLSKFTGISRNKINSFLDYNNVSAIFEHPASLSPKAEHVNKINDLKFLRNCYLNLKNNDIKYVLNSSSKAGEYFVNYFMDWKDKEKFVCSFLDSQYRVIATSIISEGTVNEAPVYPREILKKAISYDALTVMLSHNHPGGSLNPSSEDINVTNLVVQALSAVGIVVTDHIIVADGQFTSLTEKGLINNRLAINNKVVECKDKYQINKNKILREKRKNLINKDKEIQL